MTKALEVRPDGTAEVTILTNPIPRHISIVAWGANNAPTTSWKASSPFEALREPPTMLDVTRVDRARVQAFVTETLDAWLATMSYVLDQPLAAAQRAAQIRALTIQAGTRVAALAAAVGPVIKSAVAGYAASAIEQPQPPDLPSVDREIARRYLAAASQYAAATLADNAMMAMAEHGDSPRCTEIILSSFSAAADAMCELAASVPDGVVGVPRTSMKAGARNSKSDTDRLREIIRLARENLGEPSEEINMDPKELQAALKGLVDSDPIAFLDLVDTALKGAKAKGVDVAKKFAWGDTGERQFDVEKIMSDIKGMTTGDQLLGAIASAVGGINIESAPSGTPAVTLRDAIGKLVASELKANPEGPVAVAVKTAVAGSVSESIKQAFEKVLNAPPDATAKGAFDFAADDEETLTPDLPGARR